MKKKKIIILNIITTLVLIAATVAWMITYNSQGEIADYNRRLIVTALDIDVKMFQYIGDEYVELNNETLNIGNMAPGDVVQFKFEVTNNNNQPATTHIVLSDFTGDFEVLSKYLIFSTTSPVANRYLLSDNYEELSNGKKMLNFVDKLSIDAKSTTTLYWNIEMDSSASNEVANKNLKIKTINFIRP